MEICSVKFVDTLMEQPNSSYNDDDC